MGYRRGKNVNDIKNILNQGSVLCVHQMGGGIDNADSIKEYFKKQHVHTAIHTTASWKNQAKYRS